MKILIIYTKWNITRKLNKSAELTAIGRGFDDKGIYYVVMVKPDNADRDIEIRIYVNQK